MICALLGESSSMRYFRSPQNVRNFSVANTQKGEIQKKGKCRLLISYFTAIQSIVKM